MVQQRCLLLIAEEACRYGAVRHEHGRKEAHSHGDYTERHKHGLPAGESSGGRMLEAERNKTADDLTSTQAAVPEGEPGRLLGLGVPLASQQHEAGCDGRLKDPKEDPAGEKTAVARRRCCASGCYTPERDVDAQPFACWDFIEDEACTMINLWTLYEQQ